MSNDKPDISKTSRLTRFFEGGSPAMPDIAILIIAFLLFGGICLLSIPLHIGFFIDDVLQSKTGEIISRQVGYITAPNWGIFSVFILPALFLYIYKFIWSFRRAFVEMCAKKMLIDAATGEPITPDRLAKYASPIIKWLFWIAISAAVVTVI